MKKVVKGYNMISKPQFGRSMAEMLMILAIVGILSIAVYLGIHYGLTKADAVNLTEDANRR